MSCDLPPTRPRPPARQALRAWSLRTTLAALTAGALLQAHRLPAAVPNALPFQGRVSVDGVPFTGTGQFRFALLDGTDTLMWTSAPDSQPVDGIPDTPVALPVNKGLYTAQLGVGMAPLLPNLFTQRDNLRLRVWFDDGTHGLQRLAPDQPLAAVGFARHSATADFANSAFQANTASSATTAATVTGPIPATQIAGTLANAQLPANVARLDTSPTFNGTVRANYFEGGGALAWVIANGSTHQAVPNTGILANHGDGPVVITLPTSPRAGDLVRVWGVGAGGWRVELPLGATLMNPPVPGKYWDPVEENRAWKSIALSADGQRIAAVADQAPVFTSADGGKTWSGHATARAWSSIATSADGQRLAATVSGGYIWTSDDYGATWKTSSLSANWGQIASSADGLKLLAVETGSRLWVSDNGGKSWTARTPEGGAAWDSAAMSADGRTLLAGTFGWEFDSSAALSVSPDGGATWPPARSLYYWFTGPGLIASSANGRELGWAFSWHGMWRSSDAGQSWTERLHQDGLVAIACSGDASLWLACGPSNPLLVSVDSGVTWNPRADAGNWSTVAASADGKVLAAAKDGGRIYLSRGRHFGASGALVDFQCLGNNSWVASEPATLNSTGQIPLDQLPGIPAERIATGTIDDRRIPTTLNGHRDFTGPVHVNAGSYQFDHATAAPLAVQADDVNPNVGYCLSLHDRLGSSRWKLGVGRADSRFSLGAAGLRDDDISVDRWTGNVGLGSIPSEDFKLLVAGDGKFTGSVTCDGIDFFSDARWKSDVAPLGGALHQIESLRPVTYNWRSEAPVSSNRDRRQIGLIAQDVAPVLPDLVHTNADGFLSLNYVALTPVLVEAVKELRQVFSHQLADKNAEITTLRARLDRLESALLDHSATKPSTAPAP